MLAINYNNGPTIQYNVGDQLQQQTHNSLQHKLIDALHRGITRDPVRNLHVIHRPVRGDVRMRTHHERCFSACSLLAAPSAVRRRQDLSGRRSFTGSDIQRSFSAVAAAAVAIL